VPYRAERLAAAIQQEISQILREMKDPRLGFVSVTNVEVSPDLRYARVYVSVLGSPTEETATMETLQHAQGFLRSELGRRIRLRHTPEISFRLDHSIRHGARINELLRNLDTPKSSGGNDE